MKALKKAVKTVSRNISVLRAENDMTVRQFSLATGLAESTIRRAQTAYRLKRPYNPKLSTLVKLSEAVGTSLDDLAKETLKAID